MNSTLATYDVVAYREQPADRILYVIDGDESRLYNRADALRVLNPKPAYNDDDYASGLLDRCDEFALDVLVSLDRSRFTIILPSTSDEVA